jgi:DMSO/TMAO reductase YedYZ molybdopterin-dependent catalytic subunit
MRHHGGVGGAGRSLRRRDVLRGAVVAAAFPRAGPGLGRSRAGEPSSPGLIVREREPENLEFPFSTLDGPITPNERFYVRSHFRRPRIDPATWRLKVAGAVARPLELSLDEIRAMPSETRVALLECSGNGRAFLAPKAQGVPWELGAVGAAEWTGTPLRALLGRAEVRPDAVEVILEGADRGEIAAEPKTPGAIAFARSLPLEKACCPEVLLAYTMNGRPLPEAHGSPVRAVVPGWYGMASVKWLARLIVSERPFSGYFQTLEYSYFERRHGLPTLVPVTEIQVKAEIARPARHEVVAAGSSYHVHGAAWAGESEVARVEVSTDGGRSWADATLHGAPARHTWRLWHFDWTTPHEPGRFALMARATDRRGQVQPMSRDPDRRNTMINHVVPIEVEVR